MRILFIKELGKYKDLLIQLVERDIKTRYRGSRLGLAWTTLNPMIMISVYTIVFSKVFRARWSGVDTANDPIYYGLNLFCGLIVFQIFAECATRGPTLITSNPNYVKKIVFPLHTLGAMITCSSSIHAIISLIILITAKSLLTGSISYHIFFIPIIWLPMILGCLGMTWLLSTIGVFIRDIGQIMSAMVSMMMFLSPIFYPAEALPQGLRWISHLNPLSLIIENTRDIVMTGILPRVGEIGLQSIIALGWCELCYRIMRSTRKYYGDLL